jgi:anthranilate synthase component II
MSNINQHNIGIPPSGVRGLIAVIDNYDSFTYNLVHYLEDLDCQVTVFRNDEFDIEELQQFNKILLSPGPGVPDEAGLLKQVIQTYAPTKSILGVCLGQQAIGEVFGGSLTNLEKVYHGVATNIKLTNPDTILFKDLPNEFEVGRYHSWVVSNQNFPNDLIITSIDENGQIMSLKHNKFDVRGVQFHPESVLTPNGKKILENWVNSRQ